jgi:stage III sporulation protein AF
MEMLGQITRQLAALVILTLLFEMMMPNGTWRRYLGVLTGLFVLLTLMTPLRMILRSRQASPDIGAEVASTLAEDFDKRVSGQEETMRTFWDQAYEREIGDALKERLIASYGDVVQSVSVRVKEGEIQGVEMVIYEEKVSNAQVRQMRAQAVEWLAVAAYRVEVKTKTAGAEAAGWEEK